MGTGTTIAPPHLALESAAESGQTIVAVMAAFAFEAPDDLLVAEAIGTLEKTRDDAARLRQLRAPDGQSEVLVIGSCYAPGGTHTTACLARLRIATVDKQVYVQGDRFWRGSDATEPQPFRIMPIDGAHAFGGPGSRRNPEGKGLAPVDIDGVRIQPLPNVQEPGNLIMGPGDSTGLTGFGPLPDRAQADQRLSGPLPAGERFTIENMHPELAELTGALPSVICRCFAVERGDGLRELPLVFDTVWLFPGEGKGVAVFRGTTETAVGEWLLAFEDAGETRDLAHYEAARRRAVDDGDRTGLVPSRLAAATAALPEPEDERSEVEKRRDELTAEARAKGEALLTEARAKLEELGVDPDDHLPSSLPEPPEEPPAAAPEDVRADAEVKRARMEQQVLDQLEGTDIDGESALAEATKPPAGPPPRFLAEAKLTQLRETLARGEIEVKDRDGAPISPERNREVAEKLADPAFAAQLAEAEKTLAAQYRRTAHRYPPFEPDPATASAHREAVIQARAFGESLAGRDLAGADLRGLDLEGVDLSEALLECAQLAGARLVTADLSRAVLAHADLTEADLSGCRLLDANLGGTKLLRAQLRDADLTGAILVDAALEDASRDGAVWPRDPTGAQATLKALSSSASPSPSIAEEGVR